MVTSAHRQLDGDYHKIGSMALDGSDDESRGIADLSRYG